MNEEFYVGWSGEAPKSYRSKARLFFMIAFLSGILIAVTFILNQRGYINSNFEFGTLTEISGQLVSDPVWALRTEEGGKVKTIPLVGFGKFGPQQTLNSLLASGKLKVGSMVTLKGTLFYYQDKYWMELTEGEQSLVETGALKEVNVSTERIGFRELEGEIVDPKCFFGVMNPGDKAVHRSCAIRCISGGVPAVLGVRENGKFVDYYFLHDENQNPITRKVLPYVGIPVKVLGDVHSFDDWKSILVNTDNLSLSIKTEGQLSTIICD